MTDLTPLSRLVPEWEELFSIRYAILNEVALTPGLGRRQLTKRLHQTERRIRNEIEQLSALGLLESSLKGLSITQLGNQVMYELEPFYQAQSETSSLENELAKLLGIKRVRIGKNPEEIANLAVRQLSGLLEHVTTLGITGGASVKLLVDKVTTSTHPELTIVPARGSLGQATAVQANTLAEELANKLSAQFYPLIAIDHLQHATREQMLQEPLIKRALKRIERIDGLVFGIGRAEEMMERRSLSNKLKRQLREAGGVGEALGNFFNQAGELVYELETFGVSLEHLTTLDCLMAIAYGADKASAVVSVSHINPNIILVTDNSCAREMFTLLGGTNGKSSD